MRGWTLGTCLAAALALALGCDAQTRHKTLTVLFDGVPPMRAPGPEEGGEVVRGAARTRARRVAYEHGPYGARLCEACHDQGMTNVLVAEGEQLCLRCHEMALDKQNLHGPVAAGSCTVCHDPHNSKYRYTLVAGPGDLCFRCHDRDAVMATGVHGAVEGVETQCTTCHDPHASDNASLLR